MTDKVDTTNNEANANFSGMPSLETLWQVQQNEGSDGFYRTYIEAAKTAQTIIHNNLALLQQQAAVLAEAVAALDMQVAVAAELKERNDFAKTLEEVANTTRIVNSTLGAYADAAMSIQKLEKGNFTPQYIMHRKEELGMQSGDLTKLLVEFSRYAQTFLDAWQMKAKRRAHQNRRYGGRCKS